MLRLLRGRITARVTKTHVTLRAQRNIMYYFFLHSLGRSMRMQIAFVKFLTEL